MDVFKSFISNDDVPTLIRYVVVLGLITVVLFATLRSLGVNTQGVFTGITFS